MGLLVSRSFRIPETGRSGWKTALLGENCCWNRAQFATRIQFVRGTQDSVYQFVVVALLCVWRTLFSPISCRRMSPEFSLKYPHKSGCLACAAG